MSKNGSNIKITNLLAVDDERSILSSLKRVFMDYDVEIEIATSGIEALQYLQGDTIFDVIISDYRMPAMNGIQFLKEASNIQPNARRILMTGQAPSEEIEAALANKIIHTHIAKPWDNDKLVSIVICAADQYSPVG